MVFSSLWPQTLGLHVPSCRALHRKFSVQEQAGPAVDLAGILRER
jgi:hypothetical protein